VASAGPYANLHDLEQYSDPNIWSVILFIVLIASLKTPLVIASILIFGYDATASSNVYEALC